MVIRREAFRFPLICVERSTNGKVYEGKAIEVVFKNSSFLHLTGVKTKLKAKEFYKHAKTKNGLKVQEFFFDKNHPYDLAEKKTDRLEELYRITNTEVLILTRTSWWAVRLSQRF